MDPHPSLKPLLWVGRSKSDLKALPAPVVSLFGYALYLAQRGGRHAQAKPLRGFGSAGVLEIVEDCAGNAYRAVYTVQLGNALYVLHVFQKKSNQGSAMPKPDRKLIEDRLKAARKSSQGTVMTAKARKASVNVKMGSGNVYADLGFADAEQMLVKAQLVSEISAIIKGNGLTQSAAAELLGLAQPKLSNMLRGQFRGLSERRLMDCLTRLGRDIEIVVKVTPRSRPLGRLSVVVVQS